MWLVLSSSTPSSSVAAVSSSFIFIDSNSFSKERLQLETARLYKLAGINPLAGCLPTLATIPVWIGLYRALSNVADEGLLAEGFFWIPSLAGPRTIAARQSESGISWLFRFIVTYVSSQKDADVRIHFRARKDEWEEQQAAVYDRDHYGNKRLDLAGPLL